MTDKLNLTEKLGPFRSSAFYALIFTGILVVFVLAILLPYNHMLKKADLEVLSLKDRLAKQELQFPLYQNLLKEIQKPGAGQLESEARASLKKEEISQISAIIKDLAEKNKMAYGKSDPDINSMINNKGLILVNVEIDGLLEDFRNFIMNLNEVPYLQDIEEIKIRSIEKNRRFELKIWLAVE